MAAVFQSASISSGSTGTSRVRFSQPLSVTSRSSSILTPIPRYSGGTTWLIVSAFALRSSMIRFASVEGDVRQSERGLLRSNVDARLDREHHARRKCTTGAVHAIRPGVVDVHSQPVAEAVEEELPIPAVRDGIFNRCRQETEIDHPLCQNLNGNVVHIGVGESRPAGRDDGLLSG